MTYPCGRCKTDGSYPICRMDEECLRDACLEPKPPLPEPFLEDVEAELWGQNVLVNVYTDAQMRVCAAAAVAAERERLSRIFSSMVCAKGGEHAAGYHTAVQHCAKIASGELDT